MMLYDVLAPYYDLLVGDQEACMRWVEFTTHHAKGKKLLDLACGSGDVTIALHHHFDEVSGCDLSDEMIERAKEKPEADKIVFYVKDMLTLDETNEYDVITCYCDSLNYITHEEDIVKLFYRVYEALKENGTFLFDVHALDRLSEFEDEYYEEGYLNDVGYVWSIQSEQEYLYQNFLFYHPDGVRLSEQHKQVVYEPMWLKKQLEDCGFEVSIYTDFEEEGIQTGEKYFFVARR